MKETKGSYIKLYKSLLEWEWFTDSKTLVVFIYLLCRANKEPNRWRGIEVGTGHTLETLPGIANATGLSVQSVRTAISHLKLTGEITENLTAYGKLIKINKYKYYQGLE